jgi:hypothetical protein
MAFIIIKVSIHSEVTLQTFIYLTTQSHNIWQPFKFILVCFNLIWRMLHVMLDGIVCIYLFFSWIVHSLLSYLLPICYIYFWKWDIDKIETETDISIIMAIELNTPLPLPHGTFLGINHMLCHMTRQNKSKRLEIIQNSVL